MQAQTARWGAGAYDLWHTRLKYACYASPTFDRTRASAMMVSRSLCEHTGLGNLDT